MKNRSSLETTALVVGAVFLLVGILGLIPGITTDYDTMTFAGHDSDAKLLGLFEVSGLHNIVHILFGIAGIAAARTMRTAAYQFLLYGGAVYLVLFVYGMLIDKDSSANFLPMNAADDILHLALGLGMMTLAVALRRRPATPRSMPV